MDLKGPLQFSDGLTLHPADVGDYIFAELNLRGGSRESALRRASREMRDMIGLIGLDGGVGLTLDTEGGDVQEISGNGHSSPAADRPEARRKSEREAGGGPPEDVHELDAQLHALSRPEYRRASVALELLSLADQDYSARTRFLIYVTLLDSMCAASEGLPGSDGIIEKFIGVTWRELRDVAEPTRLQTLERILGRLPTLGHESARDSFTRLLTETTGLSVDDARTFAGEVWNLRRSSSWGTSAATETRVEAALVRMRELARESIRGRFFPASSTGLPGDGTRLENGKVS